MSWSCPYEEKGFCRRLKKACAPLTKGCIIQGSDEKLKVIGGRSFSADDVPIRRIVNGASGSNLLRKFEEVKGYGSKDRDT